MGKFMGITHEKKKYSLIVPLHNVKLKGKTCISCGNSNDKSTSTAEETEIVTADLLHSCFSNFRKNNNTDVFN